ncbi:hypothetical protein VTN02DRAFT_692 [Thermoascus thermophilus]
MAQAEPPRGVRPGDHLLVIHDFDARGADELTLRRGDRIELIELDDGFGDGWYLGRHLADGGTGLFPGIYTTATPRSSVRPSTVHDGETTPQASRRASLADTQVVPPLEDEPADVRQSPRQPRRSSSSPPPPATPPRPPGVHRAMRDSVDRSPMAGEESPVMNETLSVIDEHITHLNTPPDAPAPMTDSGSEYSTHGDPRLSYIHGQETDEEEEEAAAAAAAATALQPSSCS